MVDGVDSSRFVFASAQKTADIVVESGEALDRQSAQLLAEEIGTLGGAAPPVSKKPRTGALGAIYVGVLSQSPAIRDILNRERILVTDPAGVDFEAGTPGPTWKFHIHDTGGRPLSIDLLKASIMSRLVLFADDLGREGYLVYRSLADNTLVITGNTAFAVMYGVYKVRDSLYRDGQNVLAEGFGTPVLPLLNNPLFEHRAVCGQTSGPDAIAAGEWEKEWGTNDGYDYRGFIDFLTEHGLNTYVNWNFMDQLTLGLPYRSERFPDATNPFHPNVKHEFYGDMLDYAHSRNIKVIALINFPDRWQGLVRCHPEIAARGFDPGQLPDDDTWRECQRQNKSPGFSGVLCASKPETRKVFRDYIRDIFEHFPQLDGIGGQFAEGLSGTCDCPGCAENFMRLQYEYFREMVSIAQQDRPDRVAYAYRSPGAAEILKRADEIPNLIWGDWGTFYANHVMGKSVVRGQCYMFHCGNMMWNEYGMRQVTRMCAAQGLAGFEKRGVTYRQTAHDYLAFREFTWSIHTDLEDLARIWTVKTFRERDDAVASAYAHWMKAAGAEQMIYFCQRFPEAANWGEYRRFAEKYERHLELFRRELKEIKREHPWIEHLREAAEHGRAYPDGWYK